MLGFSDHLVTFCSRGGSKDLHGVSDIKKIRSLKSYSPELLNLELSKVNWSSVLSSSNVDFCLDEFARIFRAVVDTVAPMRDVRVRQKASPWINQHILAGIRKRDELLSRFKRNRKDAALYKEYCRVRNLVQRPRQVIFVIRSDRAREMRENYGDY